MKTVAWTDEKLEERFDGIDRRFDEVDRRLSSIEGGLTRIWVSMVGGLFAVVAAIIAKGG